MVWDLTICRLLCQVHPSSSFTSFTPSQCFGQVAEYLGDVFDGIRGESNPSCPKRSHFNISASFYGMNQMNHERKQRISLTNSSLLFETMFTSDFLQHWGHSPGCQGTLDFSKDPQRGRTACGHRAKDGEVPWTSIKLLEVKRNDVTCFAHLERNASLCFAASPRSCAVRLVACGSWCFRPWGDKVKAAEERRICIFLFIFFIFFILKCNYVNYVWLEGPVEQYLAGLEAHVRLSLREILEQATYVRDAKDAEEDVPEKHSTCRRIWGCRCFEVCQKIPLTRKTSRTIPTIFNHIQEYTHWDIDTDWYILGIVLHHCATCNPVQTYSGQARTSAESWEVGDRCQTWSSADFCLSKAVLTKPGKADLQSWFVSLSLSQTAHPWFDYL